MEADLMLQEIGNAVRAERMRRGWSLERLANEAYVSIPSLKRVEGAEGSQAWVLASVVSALGMRLGLLPVSESGSERSS